MAYAAITKRSAGEAILASDQQQMVDNFSAVRAAQINVVQTVKSDTTTYSSLASATWTANVTGLDVTITPSASTSKVLIALTLSLTGDSSIGIRLMRGASAIAVGDAAGSRARETLGHEQVSTSLGIASTVLYVDSPATTSATTYGVQLYNQSGIARNLYVNRGTTDTDANNFGRQISSIVVMEVPV